ncbi:MAG: cytochrome c-type biogenesis protein CcmH [Solirubrobacteraceae bacterium]|nr:cytochrome c-type biogenesis protein CcmH [Solirubrobacteraceae bacterium]
MTGPRALLALAVALLALAGPAAAPVAAAEPKTTLSDVEDEVMCPVCGVPLNLAEAPQADRERAFIQDLIDQGLTKEEIKAELVAEYGEQVLADPPSGGFNVAAWLVPLLLVAGLGAAAAVLLPRWRRRTPPAPAAADAVPDLDEADARRLDEDLARYR